MAKQRNAQKLINYHGIEKANLLKDNLNLGEIAVVHKEDEPLLGIRVSGNTKDEIAFFVASAGVISMIDTKMTGMISEVGEIKDNLNTLSGEVVNNYVTSASVVSSEAALANDLVVSAATIAEDKDKTLANTILTSAATMDGVMSAKTIESAVTYVSTYYATKEEVETAKDALATSAASIADAKDATLANGLVESAASIAEAKDKTIANDILVSAATMDGVMSAASVQSAVTYVVTYYATKEEVETAKDALATSAASIADAKDATLANGLVESAASIAEAKDKTLANTILTSAATMDGVMSAASVQSAVTYVATYYATKEELATAKDAVVTSAAGVAVASAAGAAVASAASMINAAVATAYRYSGSVNTVADLPTSAAQIGVVYNVISASGEPGTSGYTPAGTNYAWNGSEWDPLGGTVDLSAYAKSEWVSNNFSLTSHTHEGMATLTDVANASARTFQSAYTVIETFSGSIISEIITNEETVAAALNDLNDNIASTSARTVESAVSFVTTYYATKEELETAKNAVVTSAAGVAVASADTIAETRDKALAHGLIESAATMDGVISAKTFESARTYADTEIAAASARTFESAITVMTGNYATKEELETAKNAVFTSAAGVAVASAATMDGVLSAKTFESARTYADAEIGSASARTVQSGVVYTDAQVGAASARTFESAQTWVSANYATTGDLKTVKETAERAISGISFGSVATSVDSSDYASGAKASYTPAGNITLDFTALEIDCGEF